MSEIIIKPLMVEYKEGNTIHKKYFNYEEYDEAVKTFYNKDYSKIFEYDVPGKIGYTDISSEILI